MGSMEQERKKKEKRGVKEKRTKKTDERSLYKIY
jgi:hypothetical protein